MIRDCSIPRAGFASSTWPGSVAGALGLPLCGLMLAFSCSLLQAMPPFDGAGGGSMVDQRRFMKEIDLPNAIDFARIKRRLEWQRQQRLAGKDLSAEPKGLKKTGQDKVLVLLVEFGGTNTFTWTPGFSTWDPLGRCDNSEFDGVNIANSAASTFFAQKYGITAPTNFTYSGPLHNQIPRPLGSNDPSATSVWVPDFSPAHFSNLVFGAGVVFDYTRQDGSVVYEDFNGKSVRDYYEDLSSKTYTISGTVLGWLKLPHSVWWYGGDGIPGARSAVPRPSFAGAIPGAGNNRSLVIDALESAKAAYPGFDWASYDQDPKDGIIDRLWIIHAGYGEEDNPGLLNRTSYGEGGLWSHSSTLGNPYQVVPGVSANAYIMMPENAGIAVLAHEFGHNLGAMDLYTYGDGQTSAGFWTLMSDSWVGFPLGYLPEAMDPMHLDQWGWLNPLTLSDPARVYTVTLGQASRFPGNSGAVRAVKIQLPDAHRFLPVQPHGSWQWWGGDQSLTTASMTLNQSITIPAGGATLEFQTAYDTEADYDYFYVEVSTNAAASWQQLARWDGTSPGFPAYQARTFSLASFANRDVLVRFRYTTDNYIEGAGTFLDDIVIRSTQVLLSDDSELQTALWTYGGPWARNNGGGSTYTHNYYLQWRNTGASGGYDQALGDARYRFGPVNPGLVVWYQDDRYGDNSVRNYLADSPSFGPKGKLLVVDAHPEPYLDPYWVARGFNNERGIVFSRGLMRDAAFSRLPGVDFHLEPPYAYEPANFTGRPAVYWFSDGQGYYAGIQNLTPSPWRTWQWDASVVIPSTVPYGVRGSGYPAGGPLEQIIATRSYIGTAELLTYQTNAIPGGSPLPGGSGNPGDVNGQFGWNVWIVHQTNTSAEVVIWNSHYAHLDADHDGLADWQEAIAGTNPSDPDSSLRMTHARLNAQNGTAEVEWASATNRVYRLWRSTNLLSGFSTVVATNLAASPPRNVFVDLDPPTDSPAFYRVEVQ